MKVSIEKKNNVTKFKWPDKYPYILTRKEEPDSTRQYVAHIRIGFDETISIISDNTIEYNDRWNNNSVHHMTGFDPSVWEVSDKQLILQN